MRKKISMVLLVMIVALGLTNIAFASSSYLTQLNTKYGTTYSCTVCHTAAPALNPFGADFVSRAVGNHTFNSTLENRDSDSDGSTNMAELSAGTLPGNPNSKPASPPPPASDTTPPTVTSFSLPSTSDSLIVPVTGFAATDDVGVTGYMVTESTTPPSASATGWAGTAPANLTFTTPGSKTLYAWAKDAAGNVSSSFNASVTVRTASQGSSGAMSIWVGQWFKLTTKITGSCSGSSGLISDSGSSVGYLKLWEWDSSNQILQGDLYEYDTATSQWSSQPLSLQFVAGSDLDFLSRSQATDTAANTTEGFTARIVGKGTGGILKGATFKSLGGYYIDALNQSGPIVNCAGGLKLTGALIQESKVPVPSHILLH